MTENDADRIKENVQIQVDGYKRFYNDHKTAIQAGALCVGVYLLEKRLVRGIVRKENAKLLKSITEGHFDLRLDPAVLNDLILGIEDTVWSSVTSAVSSAHLSQARQGLDELKKLRAAS